MPALSPLLSHLIQDYGEPVKDPLWRNIPLSKSLLRLVAHSAFQKLNGIRQLGPTYLVYPGATHTRLSHSLGVFHLARRTLMHLLMNCADPALPVELSRDFPERLTVQGGKAFLCAALLHDLGHYPYAHSLKELDLESHEALTAKVIAEPGLSRLIHDEIGVDPQLVAAIVDPHSSYSGGEELGLYRNLLSGVLDPDKLDYLNRDAYFCGVPHGLQDVDFVLAEIRPQPSGPGITTKGLSAVESILFSKYLMYKTVYWHKTVRIATAMIKKAVLLALKAGVLRARDLYRLDDAEFFALTRSRDFPPFELVRGVEQRRLYKVVAAVPFAPENELHTRLQNLEFRLRFEEQLAREAGCDRPEAVIVDLPEPIRFEIDLPVIDSAGGLSTPFQDSPSVFSRDMVQAFPAALRRISLFVEDGLTPALGRRSARSLLLEGLK
jgi:HD superfamily phosphohydrolase